MKKLIPILTIALILLLPVWGFGATYYMRSDADPGGDGSADDTTNAWDEIADINAKDFSSGDVVNIRAGDTFNDATLTFAGVSAPIDPLSIQGADFGTKTIAVHGKPLLDGDANQPINITNTNISNLTVKNIRADGDYIDTKASQCRFENIVGLVIDGLDLDGTYGGYHNNEAGQNAISIDETVTGSIEVKNSTIHSYGPADGAGVPTIPSGGTDSIGIYINGRGDATISVHDNTIYNMNGDAIQILQYEGSDATIENNEFYNLGENGVDLKGTDNVVVQYNDMYRTDDFTGETDGCIHVIVHEGSQANTWSNNIIQYNKFTENSTRECVGITVAGDGDETIAGTLIRQNYFQGLDRGVQIGTNQTGTIVSNNEFIGPFDSSVIYENSGASNVYYNNTISDSGLPPVADAIWSDFSTGSVFTNNIISWDSATYNTFTSDNVGSDPVLSYNLHYNPSKVDFITWNGANYGDPWGDWTAITTGELNDDPLFKSVKTLGSELITASDDRDFTTWGNVNWVGYSGGTIADGTGKLEVTLEVASASGATLDLAFIGSFAVGDIIEIQIDIWRGTTAESNMRIYLGSDFEGIVYGAGQQTFTVYLEMPLDDVNLRIYAPGGADADGGTYYIDNVTMKVVTPGNYTLKPGSLARNVGDTSISSTRIKPGSTFGNGGSVVLMQDKTMGAYGSLRGAALAILKLLLHPYFSLYNWA